MKNIKNLKIIHKAKRLIAAWSNNGCSIKGFVAWLFTRPDTVVCDRPLKRDIHLNSSAAIRIYLSMLDRPIHSDITRINETGGGTPDEDEE